jgi:hypothetical protein
MADANTNAPRETARRRTTRRIVLVQEKLAVHR